MKKFAVIVLMIGIGSVPAFADSFYTLTATGTEANGQSVAINATLDLSAVSPGLFQVVGATGTVLDPWGTTVSITGVTNSYVSPFSQDNLVSIPADFSAAGSSGQFWFDTNGLLFTTSINTPGDAYDAGIAPDQYYPNGQYQFADTGANIAGTGPGGQVSYPLGNWPYNTTDLSVTLTPVPDGGTTLALLGLALAGLAGLRRKLSM